MRRGGIRGVNLMLLLRYGSGIRGVGRFGVLVRIFTFYEKCQDARYFRFRKSRI